MPDVVLPQNKKDSELTYRMSLLPFGTYSDPNGGHDTLGFAVPGMIEEPLNALSRLMGTPSHPGSLWEGPDSGTNADDMRTLLLSTYGGNALNPGRMLEGAAASEIGPSLLSDTGKPSLPGAIVTGAETNTPLRASTSPQTWYHGSPYEFDNLDLGEVAARRGYTNNGFAGISFAPSRREAASYGPNVIRARTNVSNPFVWNLDDFPNTLERARQIYPDIDQSVRDMDFPVGNRWEFAQALKNAGHDALDINLDGRTNERVVFDPANLTLFSDTSKPSIMGSALAGAEAPQRMYHGTGVPEDFSTFKPSTSGSFGPGVYFSTEPDVASEWASMGSQPRVIPADVAGPFATDADYWKAYAANNSDRDATMRALLDQGFNGVKLDTPGRNGNINITNVFRPGTVTSPLTGETLFSDTGKPSPVGATLAGAERPSPNVFSSAADFFDNPMSPGEARFFLQPGNPNKFTSRYANADGSLFSAYGGVDGPNALIDLIKRDTPEGQLSRSAMREWRDQFQSVYPDIESFTGGRISGAKAANEAKNVVQTIPASLLSDTGLPSLWGSALNQNQPPRNALWDY